MFNDPNFIKKELLPHLRYFELKNLREANKMFYDCIFEYLTEYIRELRNKKIYGLETINVFDLLPKPFDLKIPKYAHFLGIMYRLDMFFIESRLKNILIYCDSGFIRGNKIRRIRDCKCINTKCPIRFNPQIKKGKEADFLKLYDGERRYIIHNVNFMQICDKLYLNLICK